MKIVAAAIMLVTMLGATSAHASPPSNYETKAVGVALQYCLPALATHTSAATLAAAEGLSELPAANEARFLAGRGGKVFLVPGLGGDTVLMVPANVAACSVLAWQMNQAAFLRAADYWFSGSSTPFTKSSDRTLAGGVVERQYRGRVGKAALLIIVSARPKAVTGGIQGMITVGTSN